MKSAKNTYVQARLRLGRLSIRVRLIPSSAKAERASLRTPGRSLTENTTLVLSLPVRAAQSRPSTIKRVVFARASWMLRASTVRPWAPAASTLPIAATPGSTAARRAASAVESTSSRWALGSSRLGQRHRMRAHQAHPLHRLFCGDQILGDRQVYLPADLQRAVHQLVQGVGHGAFHGVLDGHDAMLDLTAFDPGEDLGDRRLRLELDAGAKRTQGGLVRERRLGPEVSDLEAGLERDGGGDDLAEHGLETTPGELPIAQRCDTVENGPLSGWGVCRKAVLVLDLTYPPRQPGTSVKQTYDLLVHRVYAFAQGLHLVRSLGNLQVAGGILSGCFGWEHGSASFSRCRIWAQGRRSMAAGRAHPSPINRRNAQNTRLILTSKYQNSAGPVKSPRCRTTRARPPRLPARTGSRRKRAGCAL